MADNYYLLPIGDSYDDTYRIEIKDQTYDFRFRWNSYDESWECYVGYEGEEPAKKFKVTNGVNLLTPYYAIDGVPPCSMVVIDEYMLGHRVTLDIGQDESNRFKIMIAYDD